MPYDIVTFGEAMLRLRPSGGQRLEQAASLEMTAGGGELNVAVGCARLGFKSAWVSRLPDNPLGRFIEGKALEQGVCTRHVVKAKDGRAGIYFLEEGASPRAQAVVYDRADSSISRIKPGEIDWSKVFDGAKRFHVSGITPALSPSAAEVTKEALVAAQQAGLQVSYDLNYRSKLWTKEAARACQEPLMRYVDVLITTEEDTKVVFGIEAPKKGVDSELFTKVETYGFRDVALKLADKFGFKGVAVTLRENTSVWFNSWWGLYLNADKKTFFESPRHEVEIVDRVGAGDSFAAGLLAALEIAPGNYDHAIRFAAAMSALKHSIPGDFCIVTRAEVETLMKGGGLRIVR